MNEISAIALQAMQQDMIRLNHLGNNIANLLTPGFKRGVSVASPINASFASLLNQTSAGQTPAVVAQNGPTVSLSLDTRPGSLRATGQSLDIAIEGQGFMEVTTPDGTFYTRQGNLRTDAQGRLVTAQGYPVAGVSGDLRLKGVNPTIDANGTISERGPSGEPVIAGQLKIVSFENNAALSAVGDGLLSSGTSALPVTATSITLRQGYLENSNANSMQEMVQMIQTMRHFESMQKIAQGYDDMLGTAIRKLGDTT